MTDECKQAELSFTQITSDDFCKKFTSALLIFMDRNYSYMDIKRIMEEKLSASGIFARALKLNFFLDFESLFKAYSKDPQNSRVENKMLLFAKGIFSEKCLRENNKDTSPNTDLAILMRDPIEFVDTCTENTEQPIPALHYG